jgi:hypothetical protein
MILAGIEETSGTDPTLTPAENAILTTGLQITPLVAQRIERNLDTDQIGNSLAALGGKHVQATFGVEIAGAGAAGDVPAWGVIARMCGFSETVEEDTDVTYALVNDLDSTETGYFYCFWDGNLHKMSYVRGTLGLTYQARDLARFQVTATGLLVPVTAATPSGAVFTGFKDPLEVNKVNTTLSLGGTPLIAETVTLSMEHQVNYVNRIGQELVQYGNPQPTGSMTLKTPALATKNFFTLAGGTPAAFELVHGAAAGSKVTISHDKMQTLEPSYADLDDKGDGLTVPLHPVGSGFEIVVS